MADSTTRAKDEAFRSCTQSILGLDETVALELECIAIEKGEGTGAILGHAGFIKTIEDLYEAMVGSVPGVKFGIAFAEASGPCLVRSDGNDDDLRRQAENSILNIAAGHTFLILFREAYPVNLINHIRNVSEVATIYCATSNPVLRPGFETRG